MKAECPRCGTGFRVNPGGVDFTVRDHEVSLQCPRCHTVFDRNRFHEPVV